MLLLSSFPFRFLPFYDAGGNIAFDNKVLWNFVSFPFLTLVKLVGYSILDIGYSILENFLGPFFWSFQYSAETCSYLMRSLLIFFDSSFHSFTQKLKHNFELSYLKLL